MRGNYDFTDARRPRVPWPWMSRTSHLRVVAAARWALEHTLHDLAIAEDALEAERQWRLTSLPALLGAIAETALEAEAEVAELRALHGVTVLPRTFPELWAAVAAEYHQSTDGNRP